VARQPRARLALQGRPGAVEGRLSFLRQAFIRRSFLRYADPAEIDAPLVRHLEKEQICDLFDVVAIIDAVMPQRVTKTPESLDDITHSPDLVSRC
jgi:hypothetical protein